MTSEQGPEQGAARVRGVLRRRRGPILIAGAVSLVVGALVVLKLEPGYRASAVVRALEAQPAHEYVPPTVVEQMGERLKTLRLAVMARPLLAEVAAELGLPARDHRSLDEVVDGMRARMEVKVEGEDTFLLSYEDRRPDTARAVVDAVAERFVRRETDRRAEIAAATSGALAGEVRALRPDLAKLEAKVLAFKLVHNGALPEQMEANLRNLDESTLELNIQSTNLDLENEHRRQLLGASLSPLRHQEELLETALHEARTHYVAEHPEVKRIGAELEAVRAKRAEDERVARAEVVSANPELAALEEQIRRTEGTIAALHARQQAVRTRVEETTANGEELLKISTDLDVVKGKYQAAVGKLRDAELAQAIERGLRTLRFALVEGAAQPRAAVRPNRPLWAVGAALASLAIALGLGFALDLRDGRLRSPAELAALPRPLSVLACVPDLERVHKEDPHGR